MTVIATERRRERPDLFDVCPSCGGRKRRRSKQCAECWRGYFYGDPEMRRLLDRADAAWRLLRSDVSVDPADVLAAVVWPEEPMLQEVAA